VQGREKWRVKRNAVQQSEVKWWSWEKCVSYHCCTVMWLYVCSVQYVVSLLFVSLCYFLITRLLLFCILVMFVSLFCIFVFYFVCFAFLYCFAYCFSFGTQLSVSFLILYKFSDHCRQVETPLQSLNIISYHIIYRIYHMSVQAFCTIRSRTH
jgi:hypothetical protein